MNQQLQLLDVFLLNVLLLGNTLQLPNPGFVKKEMLLLSLTQLVKLPTEFAFKIVKRLQPLLFAEIIYFQLALCNLDLFIQR